MIEARLYERLEGGAVRCNLCQHRCRIARGGHGVCMVRKNVDGVLQSLVYGKAIAGRADPIEKKPLFHFLPGSLSWSFATVGCNFTCVFCQNADIAQMPRDYGRIAGNEISPRDIVERAVESGCRSISYTYTEPTVFYEYAEDTALAARAAGLKNVFVTNGYMTPEAVQAMSIWLDAANVDLKAFSREFYKTYCGADLDKVMESITALHHAGIRLEITTLLIPTLNDDESSLRELAGFIAALSPDIPWHISRFHPAYHLTRVPPTPLATMKKAQAIGREAGLRYIYLGNVPGEGEDTLCPDCGTVLIRRYGFEVLENALRESRCPSCKSVIPIIL